MSCTDLVMHVHHVGLHLRVGITQVVDLLVELLDVLVVVQNYNNHGAVRTSAVVQDYKNQAAVTKSVVQDYNNHGEVRKRAVDYKKSSRQVSQLKSSVCLQNFFMVFMLI